jgi:crotonobetainyl-CoA:carnitine CoA-transferase CaiB-like acyl-CoA transferase
VTAALARFGRNELTQVVDDLDLMGLPVNSLPDLGSCGQLDAIGEFTDVRHESLQTTLRVSRSPVGEPAEVGIRRAPALGEHTTEILGASDRSRRRRPGKSLDDST